MTPSSLAVASPLLGSQTPTYACRPPAASTVGPEATEIMAAAGVDLDPWQSDFLDTSMGRDVAGRWVASECGLVVPRQNGKGEPIAARVLWGALFGGERLILWTSHEVKTNLESFFKLRSLIEGCPDLDFHVRVIREANGSEGVYFRNGARVRFIARSRSSGRGFSPQLVIFDEAYDLDDPAIAALIPTLSAQDAPQRWYVSSAPHPYSAVLRRVMTRGREGEATRLAYAEFCAPDAAASDEPEAWAAANPALGVRISPEAIEDGRARLRSTTARRSAEPPERRSIRRAGSSRPTTCTSCSGMAS